MKLTMKPITGIPTERPTYRELEESNTWLKGSLHEARQSQKKTEQLSMMCLVLLAVTATLLALTWGGVIVI